MSLSRQLVLLVATLVLLLFVGTFLISVYSTRDYLQDQLASHAQDAATSLGLSASSHVASGDKALFTSMVNAMVHRGDYLSIRIEDLKGHTLVERHGELRPGVPAWFMRLFPLHPPEGQATMMSGWRQVGVVRVVSHPGLAYRKLWRTTLETLEWFLAGAGLVLLAGLLLLRLMLRPLKKVEWQAEAICNREFPINEERPFTLEFRRIVEAMNRLSQKVRQMLDNAERMAAQLREQAFTDSLTGLANRRHFMDLLQARLEDEHCGGGILLLQIDDLAAINQRQGYAAGDRLLQAVARHMRACVEGRPDVTLAHLSGGDFAVLYEGAGPAALRELAERLAAGLADLYSGLSLDSPDVGHVGGCLYQDQSPGELMARADMALRQAQQQGANAWVVLEADAECEVCSASEWCAVLEQALEKGFFQLQKQPVYAGGEGGLLHQELFLRLINLEGGQAVIPAGVFMPMAEAVGLASRVDRWVITEVAERALPALGEGRVAVNMSPASLADPEFLEWLDGYLADHAALRGRLILEWPEYGAIAHVEALRAWISRLAPLGVEFSLDHFGKGFSSFAAIRELKAHYLKIDGSFTRNLDEGEDNAFFVQAVTDIAHGLDLVVIAESVESEAVWDRLAGLGVDGGRGYWLGVVSDVRA